MTANKSLLRTFDPPRTFAFAGAAAASNAAELRRNVSVIKCREVQTW